MWYAILTKEKYFKLYNHLMIGLCTPPVGTSLFICAKTANIIIEKMYKAILPFLVPLIIVLFLITYVPGFVTWLPGTLG